VAAGQSIDVYFASDFSWSSSGLLSSLLELVVQEPADISNTLNIKPIALFATRNISLTAQRKTAVRAGVCRMPGLALLGHLDV
jgi:hypothetical protein